MEVNSIRRGSIQVDEIGYNKYSRKTSVSTAGTSRNPRSSKDMIQRPATQKEARELPKTQDKSFGSIIAQATYGSNAKYAASNDGKLDEIIPNFVSKHIRRVCHTLQLNGELTGNGRSEKELMMPQLEPSATEAFAAVVMVDVSGYSKLAATLAERGALGAELLSKTMKGYFDLIIQVIIDHGGDIVKFAGDAVILCWKSEDLTDYTDSTQDILRGEMVYQAAKCCLKLLTDHGEFAIDIKDCDTKLLRIHLGIGAGKVFDVIVGGEHGRWEHFVAGDGANQLSQVLDLAKAAHVIDIRTLNLGNYDKRCILLTGLEQAQRKGPAIPWTEPPPPEFVSPAQQEANLELYKRFMDRTAVFKLQADVNQSRLFGIDPNLQEMLNMAELRQVTTVFIKIGSLHTTSSVEILDESQKAISVVLRALHRCEGSLRQFHVDDKGAVILCFFGLPPLAHDNDAKLGIQAAIEIKEQFLDIFETFSIGVTTGVVSYGGVGTIGRAEYAVMGDAINMAARLMCLPKAYQGLLCDERTYNLCQPFFSFDILGETKVKGKSSAISVFRPIAQIQQADLVKKAFNEQTGLIGRGKEKQAIEDVMNAIGESSVASLSFEADEGQGLSSIAQHVSDRFDQLKITHCVSRSVQIEKTTPFFSVIALLWKLIELVDTAAIIDGHLIIGPSEVELKVRPSTTTLRGPASSLEVDQQLPMLPGKRRGSNFQASNPLPCNIEIVDEDSIHPEALAPMIFPVVKEVDEVEEVKRDRRASFSPKSLKMRESIDRETSPPLKTQRSRHSIGTVDDIAPNISRIHLSMLEVTPSAVLFGARASNALKKLGLPDHYLEILSFLQKPIMEDQVKLDVDVKAKFRSHEITEVIQTCLEKLSEKNKIALSLVELQWADSFSLEILSQIAHACDRVAFFIFCRPRWTYDIEDTKGMIDHIQQIPKFKHFELQAFSLDDTSRLVLEIWATPSILTVNPKISESIMSRTGGNPFYIKSLAIAMKESGQWRISPIGELVPQSGSLDSESLALGYDNQGIILGRFDRIDRNLQLFLKVAAVLGIKWALDDVLYFVTGIMNLSAKVDNKSYNAIIKGVISSDKYGFIQSTPSLLEPGACFSFKSAVIRKCIYSLMAHKQRQQVHLYAAQYFESKLTDQNRHRLLTQILEHYMETTDDQFDKKLLYVRLVAKFYYEIGSSAECVIYYRLLLQMTKEKVDSESDFVKASWYREFGDSLYSGEDWKDAYGALLKSLQLMSVNIPTSKFLLWCALQKQNYERKKHDANFINSSFFKEEPLDYEYTTDASSNQKNISYNNNMALFNVKKQDRERPSVKLVKNGSASKISIANIYDPDFSKRGPVDPCSSPNVAIQHALQVMSEIYLHRREYMAYCYSVFLGLSLHDNSFLPIMTARLFSSAAIILALTKERNDRSKSYMDAAMLLDDRNDPNTSLLISINKGIFLTLNCEIEKSVKFFEIATILSRTSCNLPSRFMALRLQCSVNYLFYERSVSLRNGLELKKVSLIHEHWEGKFWGIFHEIKCLFLQPNASAKIQEYSKEMANMWADGPELSKDQIMVHIAHICVTACVPLFVFKMFVSEPGNLVEHLKDLNGLLETVTLFDWEIFESVTPLMMGFFTAISHKQVIPTSATSKMIQKVCNALCAALKKIKIDIADTLRRIFKGIERLAAGKIEKAVKIWKKALNHTSELKFYQGILLIAIGHYAPDIDTLKAGQVIMETLECPEFEKSLSKFS